MSLYDITVKDMKGQDVSLANYKGQVLLIVNTATGCGFTPQYVGLQKLYDSYREQGFSVLDFPCNQFGGQAPGTADEIHDFCVSRFALTFPQFDKIKVNGPEASPLYTFLKGEKGGLLGSAIKWNFTKFLVGRDGTVLARFAPQDKPEDLVGEIEEALKALSD